ncbi:MAG TPA: hypothetical protein P5228_05710 [Bacteroidales bacterium]|nr:hypothetical protein [Bacteroidales bacterium]HRZ49236.1 hypothetical protein [Bacteroidales bacterium]
MNEMIKAYYLFQCLPEPMRKANGIKSKARLDCIRFVDKMPEGYKGLEPFQNHKGQLFFYKTPAHSFINAETRRISEWSLTNNSLNLSSIYIEDTDYPQFGYGYPNANRILSTGLPNPLYAYHQDAYLFICNEDYTRIELMVVPAGRNLVSAYYQKLIDGGFDVEIQRMRSIAVTFYPYLDGGCLL